jgi:GrpB-like predicted nucleotidyltransferase (UPF0157 family)
MADNLKNLSTEELGIIFPIIIVDYNRDWPAIFLREKQKIVDTIGGMNISAVEHIGSTAVPGLCAKPTIDILIEITEDTNSEVLIGKLNRLSYQFIPKPENPPPHMMFAKGYSMDGITGQTFHIHVRYPGEWDEIVFRNYLIDNHDAAQEYAELKKKLAIKFRNDREKYTENKGTFIKNIIQKARRKT